VVVAADGVPPERVDAGPVILRRVRASDAAAIAAAVGASLAYLRPWLPWATPAAADRRNQLSRVAEADQWWESGIRYTYSIVTADHGALVGEIALHRRSGEASAELGYWIAASEAGRGYGTAAGGAITAVALALPGVARAEIHCDAANAASAAIARKLGYRLYRVAEREPEASGESGRLMIWVREALDRVAELPAFPGSGRHNPQPGPRRNCIVPGLSVPDDRLAGAVSSRHGARSPRRGDAATDSHRLSPRTR
jgi:RimJ/RimL family protein N-acetyltransferase